jgi:biopolymer transport protein TolR
MGAKVGDNKGGAMADLNVTPLVDVVLVLLIIFMVVTPMLGAGVDVQLPAARTATEDEDLGQNLVVSVKDDGTAYVDRDAVTLDTILERVREVRDDRPIMIKADAKAKYKDVRQVMDKLHELPGTDTMLLATDKKKE